MVFSPTDKTKLIYVKVLSSRGTVTYFEAVLLHEIQIHFLMHFFPSDICPSNILFLCNFLMMIFQIFHYKICNLYFIIANISELHLLFISSPRTRCFRYNFFLSETFMFSFFYSFRPKYSVSQLYWKISEVLNSQILKNQCFNIVPGTESGILVHLLLVHFWETSKISIFRRRT